MDGLGTIFVLIVVLVCLAGGFWLLRTIVGFFVSGGVIVLVAVVLLVIWSPGPLASVFGPFASVIRVPFELAGEILQNFGEMLRIIQRS